MTELPSDISLGYVVGRYILMSSDDSKPLPASGTIYFSPVSALTFSDVAPPTSAIKHTFEASLDAEGYVSDDGQRGVWLAPGSYTVTFRFNEGTMPAFKIRVLSTHNASNPLDLVLAKPIESLPTEKWVVNEQVYRDTLKARDEAIEAAESAGNVGPEIIAVAVGKWLEENPVQVDTD